MPDTRRLAVGPFEENTYLHSAPEGLIVVDPGDEPDRILAEIGAGPVAAVLVTHAHLDHIGALAAVRGLARGHVYGPLGEKDWFMDPAKNLSALYRLPLRCDPPEHLLSGGERLMLGGAVVEVLFVPGHSPGHLAYLIGDFLYAGDTLMAGTIGRSDFPGGDGELLLEKIASEILSLPDSTHVFPGHGPATTVVTERRFNPFVGRR